MTLFGAFRVTDGTGRDRTPKGAKAKALIAMVLMAPDASRSRAYLAQHLWSDRAQAQALASLRQAISEIRAVLGPASSVFETDRKTVGFAPGTVETDFDQARDKTASGLLFLEDVQSTDAALSDWLEELRGQFCGRERLSRRLPVEILWSGSADEMHHRMLSHGIANSLGDWCALPIATLADAPDRPAPVDPEALAQYLLSTRMEASGGRAAAHVSLSDGRPAAPKWSMTATVSGDPVAIVEDTELLRLINRTVERTLLDLAPGHADAATNDYLATGTLGSVRLIFRNRPGDLKLAKTQLSRNYEVHRKGLYLAWLAYITTMERAEKDHRDQRALQENAEALCRKALELDPCGSMTLALVSYAASFILGDRARGIELATRALEINRANPLAWLHRGAAYALGGDGLRGVRDSEMCQRIQGGSFYSYVVDTFSCAAATSAGMLDDAVRYAERATQTAPLYRAPLRYLTAIHAARGDMDELRLAIRRLRRLEPDFTIDSLSDKDYPVPGLRAVGLVRSA
ncbi:hypothetical protein [Marinovum sp.]|uniref:hypothetical protein n=1 Tax=Marinovum sp. TaxID=2024839 RepID=UPI002B264CA0|nr:hypothetical protein [Marinovum sp.]